ncbi:hypothetical protein BDY21DRAFT_411749 [Lineolata rhizophorae]|uniref:Uncharacterized protein n=1 Tax=Lineolata rhizophorae TaxID=578093 RepID=A0A6A6P3F2_9PEZI|nr:hypothetical protein BDY21DRAFT_411749 [Lineolata rhizophorae]
MKQVPGMMTMGCGVAFTSKKSSCGGRDNVVQIGRRARAGSRIARAGGARHKRLKMRENMAGGCEGGRSENWAEGEQSAPSLDTGRSCRDASCLLVFCFWKPRREARAADQTGGTKVAIYYRKGKRAGGQRCAGGAAFGEQQRRGQARPGPHAAGPVFRVRIARERKVRSRYRVPGEHARLCARRCPVYRARRRLGAAGRCSWHERGKRGNGGVGGRGPLDLQSSIPSCAPRPAAARPALDLAVDKPAEGRRAGTGWYGCGPLGAAPRLTASTARRRPPDAQRHHRRARRRGGLRWSWAGPVWSGWWLRRAPARRWPVAVATARARGRRVAGAVLRSNQGPWDRSLDLDRVLDRALALVLVPVLAPFAVPPPRPRPVARCKATSLHRPMSRGSPGDARPTCVHWRAPPCSSRRVWPAGRPAPAAARICSPAPIGPAPQLPPAGSRAGVRRPAARTGHSAARLLPARRRRGSNLPRRAAGGGRSP